MASEPVMAQSLSQLWLWLLQHFGLLGTLLMLLLVLLLCLAWVLTLVGVWLLYRKGRILEQYLVELRDRSATQSRYQQVERLRRDKTRQRPGRRR
jgi:biopolymer transport protein ExbB/TolQ